MLNIKKSILIFRFRAKCKNELKTNAKIYNGLFASILKVAEGNAKRADGVVREWKQRTQNRFPESSMLSLIERIQSCDERGTILAAKVIMDAAKKVGIAREEASVLVLNEKTVLAYTEWNGNELYEGDKVKVISPAWYQNGMVLEQGHCEIFEETRED